jgi:hypothetical protein
MTNKGMIKYTNVIVEQLVEIPPASEWQMKGMTNKAEKKMNS